MGQAPRMPGIPQGQSIRPLSISLLKQKSSEVGGGGVGPVGGGVGKVGGGVKGGGVGKVGGGIKGGGVGKVGGVGKIDGIVGMVGMGGVTYSAPKKPQNIKHILQKPNTFELNSYSFRCIVG